MDEARRDKRFKVLFQPLRSNNSTVNDDDGWIINEPPLPFAIQRRTRASNKARSVGGFKED